MTNRELKTDPVGYYLELHPEARPEKEQHFGKVESVLYHDNRELRPIERKPFTDKKDMPRRKNGKKSKHSVPNKLKVMKKKEVARMAAAY